MVFCSARRDGRRPSERDNRSREREGTDEVVIGDMEAVTVPEVVHEGAADGAAADTMTYPTEVSE